MTAGRPIEGTTKVNILRQTFMTAKDSGPFQKASAIERCIDEAFKLLTDFDDRMTAIEKRIGLK